MTKRPAKFGTTVPELKDVISKYGCGLGTDPPYIVVGEFRSKTKGPFGGILAAAQNQFYAYLIWREVQKNGDASVKRSEFHPKTNFSIAGYKQQLRDKMEAQKQAAAAAEKQEQPQPEVPRPRPRIVSWSDKKDNSNA
jgi:hypothetical protein